MNPRVTQPAWKKLVMRKRLKDLLSTASDKDPTDKVEDEDEKSVQLQLSPNQRQQRPNRIVTSPTMLLPPGLKRTNRTVHTKTLFLPLCSVRIFDPLGRPTVPVGSGHYFRTCCPSVRPQQNNVA